MTSPVSPSETIAKAIEGVTLDRIERLWWFLHVLAKCSGTTNANDDRWNWISAFCTDFSDDTFNRAAKLGFIRVTHNDLTEDSTARLTDAGHAFVSYFTEMPSAALALQLEAMQREMAEKDAEIGKLRGLMRDNGTPKFNAVCERAESAERDLEAALAVVKECHSALKMLISPGVIQGTTVIAAFAAATAAECRARALIQDDKP